MRTSRTFVLCLLLSAAWSIQPGAVNAATKAAAKESSKDVEACRPKLGPEPDPDVVIKGCTALILSHDTSPSLKAWAYVSRGVTYGLQGQNQQSIADLTESITISATISDNLSLSTAYLDRGGAYYHDHQYDKSISDYRKILELFPSNTTAHDQIALVYSQTGHNDLALIEYNVAINFNPKEFTYYNDRGSLYLKENNLDKAIEDYTTAITIIGDTPEFAWFAATSYSRRARSHLLKGEGALALPDAEQAVKMAPQRADVIETRAEIYERLRRRDDAVLDYRSALKLHPDLKEAEDGLKRLGATP